MELHESSEDYLEAMLIISEKNGSVRSIDIAKHLGVTKPSVSYAVKRLRENKYINMADDGNITFTKQGKEIATKIYGRHKKLTSFFEMLGVDKEIAQIDACKIEHDLSPETYKAICSHVDKMTKGK